MTHSQLSPPNPAGLLPIQHRMTRRSKRNNYLERRIYMITLTAARGIPKFGELTGDPRIPSEHSGSPYVVLTELGKRIDDIFNNIEEIHSDLKILERVIMPDHIHFIVWVTNPLSRHLGKYIGKLKTRITQALWRLYPALKQNEVSTFASNYHDRILLKRNQLTTLKKYIADNPRRLAIKQLYSDFFRRIIGVEINGEKFNCYGNVFLLMKPDKMPIKVRSAWSDQDFEEHESRWIGMARNGAIGVSPFISKREKIIREKLIDMEQNLIIVKKENFPDRFKPQGREFELCSEGRLLLICPCDSKDHDRGLARAEANELNRIARLIAETDCSRLCFGRKIE